MKQKLTNYFKAGVAGLYIQSPEGQRVEGEVAAAAAAAGFGFYTWTATKGVIHIKPGKGDKPPEAVVLTQNDNVPPHVDALDKFDGLPEKSVILLHDMHMFIEPDPMFIRRIKDSLLSGKMKNRVLIILGCILKLVPELEKEITVIDFSLPNREQLLGVAENIAKSAGIVLNGETEALMDAASGLTTIEAEDAFSLSVVETGALTAAVVSREKSATVKKNGILEIVDANVTLDDIGGLENLKADLHAKRHLFTKAAREYGLDTPRGILIVGQPGTGKSLSAFATKTVFNLPLVRLDAGRIFGSHVGESERNWRSAFATVKAIAPCILWVDEVDGLFSGAGSSGKTDGGTTDRVIKSVLQDMQFNGEGIFFVFTANDVDKLPDPLIDRLDVWSVDLPNVTERSAIWKIHIEKRKRKADKFGVPALAEASDGFSGRQIEQVLQKAMVNAFNSNGRQLETEDIMGVLRDTTPTSKLMAKQIEERRARLKNRAQSASAQEMVPVQGGRKIAS
jgi:AAA+ superfamily predicted ATPase